MEKLAGSVACGAGCASRQRGIEGERWKGVPAPQTLTAGRVPHGGQNDGQARGKRELFVGFGNLGQGCADSGEVVFLCIASARRERPLLHAAEIVP